MLDPSLLASSFVFVGLSLFVLAFLLYREGSSSSRAAFRGRGHGCTGGRLLHLDVASVEGEQPCNADNGSDTCPRLCGQRGGDLKGGVVKRSVRHTERPRLLHLTAGSFRRFLLRPNRRGGERKLCQYGWHRLTRHKATSGGIGVVASFRLQPLALGASPDREVGADGDERLSGESLRERRVRRCLVRGYVWWG